MAISLSNHEDRIKALEEPITYTMILHHDFNSSSNEVVIHRSDYDKYDMLLFFADVARSNSDRKESGSYRGMSLIPTKVIINHKPTAFTPGFTYTCGEGYSVYAESFECRVNENADLTLSAFVNYGNWSDNRMIVYGLKLYYNFSYNIYRLANSTSFHFFKCLINSFKGGVKEIWQLVLKKLVRK